MVVGYARVSTRTQKIDRQIDSLKAAGCERIFQEKISGATLNRPELSRAIDILRSGDTLVVDSFSRLSRSTKDLLSTVDKLTSNGVNVISLKERFDTTTATGQMMLTMFSALIQFERELTIEQTKDGLEAASARGRKGGRPKVGNAKTKKAAMAAYDANIMTNKEIAEQFGISTATLSRWIKEHKMQ